MEGKIRNPEDFFEINLIFASGIYMDDRGGNFRLATTDAASGLALGTPPAQAEAAVFEPLSLSPAPAKVALAPRSAYLLSKRLVDILGAMMLTIIFSPVLVLVTLSLYQDGGTILFRHTRVGKGGKVFKVFKFRTMVPNADKVLRDLLARDSQAREEWLRDHKLKDDPRITAIGKFLRKTSLDELPQLWNVVKGEMSLVGPRPIVREEIRKYGRAARYYFAVKPGLTGLWQVSGRNDTDYHRRVAIDRRYASEASLSLDLIVLVKTIHVVLRGRGAY